MRKFKKLLAGALIAAMTLSLGACGDTESEGGSSTNSDNASVSSGDNGSSTELTKVRIGIDTEQLAFVQVVAKEKGYFEENGLDAELTGYAAGIETINAVVLGEVDIGGAYDYAACTRLAEKTNLRLASGFVMDSVDTNWYETSATDVDSVAGLKGKRIGILQGTVQEYLWAKVLESAGLTYDDVDVNYLGSNAEVYTAYVAGQVDAVQGKNTFLEQLETVGDRKILVYAGDVGAVSQGYIMGDATFLEEHQDAVEGYYKALNQALDFINANKADAAAICADYLTLSAEDVEKSLSSYNYEIRFSQEDYDHIQDIADWCVENGVISEALSIKDYMNIDAIKAVYPDKVTYQE